MIDLPPAVRAALHDLLLNDRQGAILRVDTGGLFIAGGGDLARYGLAQLAPGAPVADAAPVLHSVLPAAETPQVVRLLEVSPGVFADVGTVRVDGSDWAVFTDYSEEATLRRQLQQRAVDLSLLREREQKALADLQAEQAFTSQLLSSIFPAAIIERLRSGQTTIADEQPHATVLFAGIYDFPLLTGRMKPVQVVDLLARLFSAFDTLCTELGVAKIKSIGESYLCVAGLPTPRPDHAGAAAELALAMQRTIAEFQTPSGEPLSLRIGIDSGPVVAGVVGTTRLAYDVWGRPVENAQQMQLFGLPGSIQLSAAAAAELRNDFTIEERGEFYVQGGGAITTYLLRGPP